MTLNEQPLPDATRMYRDQAAYVLRNLVRGTGNALGWKMTEADLQVQLEETLSAQGLSHEQLQTLASQLVWRIGRSGDDGPVTVRVGFAKSAALFAELPRLKNATDAELEEAAKGGALRVEWIGARPRL